MNIISFPLQTTRNVLGFLLFACILWSCEKEEPNPYTRVLSFEGESNGAFPYELISDGAFIYGMTSQGGINDLGIIFKIKPDGSEFTKLLEFQGTINGSNPRGALLLADGILYGMTSEGGVNDKGTIFKISTDGTGYTKLYDFAGLINGGEPFGSLISDGIFLYGMTVYGGSANKGIIFKIKMDGTGFAKLLDFNGLANGSYPLASLITDGTFFYGTTSSGGANDRGTIFKIMPNGTGYVKLLDFDYTSGIGFNPMGNLFFDGTFLFGLTERGGLYDSGALFKIKPDGTSYSILLNFSPEAKNGVSPSNSLIFDGDFMYGTADYGGIHNYGVLFKIKTDGSNFTKLIDFDDVNYGGVPNSTLIINGGFLFGTTVSGGTADKGTIFKYKL